MSADLLPSPFPPAALPQLDILDDALAEYLDALELYQLAQQRLADQLKQGYFELSRAKVALGPLRLSQSSYDLSETESRVAVTITDDDPRWSLGQSASCLAAEAAAKAATAAKLASATTNSDQSDDSPHPADSLASAKSTAAPASNSNLRSRSTPASSSTNPSTPLPPPRPTSRNPLLQFSAMPPPALVASQKHFSAFLSAAVEVVRRREVVERLEDKVREVRKELAVAVGGGGAGEGRGAAGRNKKQGGQGRK